VSLPPAPAEPRPSVWPRRPIVLVAGAAIIIVAVAGAILGASLLGRPQLTGPVVLASRLPADTLVYLELDLEPTGSQAAALEALNDRLGVAGGEEGAARLLDPLLDGLTGGAYRYSRDVRPWFDGHVALAVLDWGSLTQLPGLGGPFAANPVAPGTVLLMGVTDRDGATALTDRLRAEAQRQGPGFVSRDSGGWTVWVAQPGVADGIGMAYAISDDLLVVATRAVDVETIMTLGDGDEQTLAQVDTFRSEIARLPAERIGTLLTRPGPLSVGALGSGLVGMQESRTAALLASFLPLTQTGALMLADDRLIFERWQPADGPVVQPAERLNAELATGYPADTAAYVELPEFGEVVNALGAAIADDARLLGGAVGEQEVDRVEQMLGRELGDLGDWLGDLAVGLRSPDPSALAVVGLAGQVRDAGSAAELLSRFVEFLRSSGFAVDEGELDGRPLVTMDVPFLFGSISLEVMMADDAVLIGTQGFATWHEQGGASLGDDPGYRSALEEIGGPQNAGLAYLAVDRVMELERQPLAPPPGLAPFELSMVRDAMMATFLDGDRVRSRLEIRFAEP
jgi:hypothetical protein